MVKYSEDYNQLIDNFDAGKNIYLAVAVTGSDGETVWMTDILTARN